MKDIDRLNKFITDTFVPIFEKSDALPESIQQKINETPYLRDVVLSSQKIVNKSQQSIQVYENVIQTPFTLSDILFDKQQEMDLAELQR